MLQLATEAETETGRGIETGRGSDTVAGIAIAAAVGAMTVEGGGVTITIATEGRAAPLGK